MVSDAEALEKFRQLPKEEQDRLMAETTRRILEDPAVREEFASLLASGIARKIEGGPCHECGGECTCQK